MKKIIIISSFFYLFVFSGCRKSKVYADPIIISSEEQFTLVSDTIPEAVELPIPVSEMVLQLQEYGLIDVQELSPDIVVDLKYATEDNFTGQIAYTDLTGAWLVPDIANRLAKVQEYLTSIHPGYKLLIYDAARPISVQRKLFDAVKGTPKSRYVASPGRTGLHNYGAAVDLTIVDSLNIPLDMGTEFDHLGREAHTTIESQLLAEGKLTKEHIQNRQLLRDIMRKQNFRVLSNEWWHFNGCTLAEAKERYKLLDF